MYRTICITILCISSLVTAVEFSDCGSKVGKFSQVSVSNCNPSGQRCILKRKTNVTIDIAFTVDKDTSKVNSVVHGVVLGVPVPFPLPNPDACANKESGLNCPLSKGSSINYKATLPVLEEYPKLSVDVKWELQDENAEDIVCVLIPAKIQ